MEVRHQRKPSRNLLYVNDLGWHFTQFPISYIFCIAARHDITKYPTDKCASIEDERHSNETRLVIV